MAIAVKQHLPAIVISLVGLLFIFIFYKLLFSSYEPFPNLSVGKYVGSFPGSLIKAGEEKIFFSIDVKEKPAILEFVIYSPGWGLRNVEVNKASQPEKNDPLIVTGPDTVLRFGGKSSLPNYFSGTVRNVSSGDEANWVLFSNPPNNENNELSLPQRQSVELKAEEKAIEMRMVSQKAALDKITEEQARLTKVLAEGKTLEQKAENRFSEKQNEIDKLSTEISKVEKTLLDMHSALGVARSITQRGRLTTMARESLAREFREINFKLSGQSRQNDAALLAELSRAKEALSLQQELLEHKESDIPTNYEPEG